MKLEVRGQKSEDPVAVIPGIQGRWEWMTPTIDALAAAHRVVTFSLTDLRPALHADSTFLDWIPAIDRALDEAHERRVTLVGVSFGGLLAACYAARRPDRVRALVLVSTPSPIWKPRPGDEFCARHPRLAFPYFCARALRRLVPEIHAARDSWTDRVRLASQHIRRSIQAPFSPVHASQWVREWMAFDVSPDCATITAPTLVVTGNATLEQVVPVDRTLQYLGLIPGATHVEFAGTGHLGVITRPDRFTEILGQFIDGTHARTTRHAS